MQTGQIHEPVPADTLQPPSTELAVKGMTCSNCARHVTEAIQSVIGVHSALVSLEEGRARIRWARGATQDVPAIIAAVQNEGFSAEPAPACSECHAEHKMSSWRLNLWIGVLGTIPLMLGEWVFNWSGELWYRWASFAIAAVVQVFAGGPFYRGAWNQLKTASSNMDTLVALGSTTAFGYSTWALLNGQAGHLYFMEAASIITLVSIGHWMESLVSVRATSALRQLLNLAPAMARRRNNDGSETEVPVAELRPGELVVLRPGDRVPTDGEVVDGQSALDESMLTGESLPVDKSNGGQVYTGTTNSSGRLTVCVTATGDETALAHIIEAVQRAQTSRANIQRLGDRVSSIFVPIVVSIAFAAALWWGLAPDSAAQAHKWLSHFLWNAHPPAGVAAPFIIAAAVLIVACPCAMGLATPAAIMAGANAAAMRGILIRDGLALEKAGKVTAILFDKTGTLTVGKLEVAASQVVRGPEFTTKNPRPQVAEPALASQKLEPAQPADHEVVALAASLTRDSAHPISQAIAKLSSESLVLRDWKEVHGGGVEAKFIENNGVSGGNETFARLGSLRWLGESGVDLTDGQKFAAEWSAQGASTVGLSVDSALIGMFAVRDTLKPGAREIVAKLEGQGFQPYLVTGDNAQTARSLAGQVGIPPERVFAEVRPEQKSELVKKLQNQGQRVAFVGDGINDAPALEQADLGIAVSRASDIAREAADIILLKSEIEAVPESLGLARATLRTIKQNLFWAFFYNSVSIPLAALGFMSPILCAAAMGLSDVVVIGNALRLRKWRL
jgi:Cu+-exporting ATPase